MYQRLKFKVGQVWSPVGTKTMYIIETIDKDGLVAARLTSTKMAENFICVDKNHFAEIDIAYWQQIVPRECPCGIDRRSCNYHQLEPYQRLEN